MNTVIGEVLRSLQELMKLNPAAGQKLLVELIDNKRIPLCQILPAKFWGKDSVGRDLLDARKLILGKIDILFINYHLLAHLAKIEQSLEIANTSRLEQMLDTVQTNVLDLPLNMATKVTTMLERFTSDSNKTQQSMFTFKSNFWQQTIQIKTQQEPPLAQNELRQQGAYGGNQLSSDDDSDVDINVMKALAHQTLYTIRNTTASHTRSNTGAGIANLGASVAAVAKQKKVDDQTASEQIEDCSSKQNTLSL